MKLPGAPGLRAAAPLSSSQECPAAAARERLVWDCPAPGTRSCARLRQQGLEHEHGHREQQDGSRSAKRGSRIRTLRRRGYNDKGITCVMKITMGPWSVRNTVLGRPAPPMLSPGAQDLRLARRLPYRGAQIINPRQVVHPGGGPRQASDNVRRRRVAAPSTPGSRHPKLRLTSASGCLLAAGTLAEEFQSAQEPRVDSKR
jgi:hypothetical protein